MLAVLLEVGVEGVKDGQFLPESFAESQSVLQSLEAGVRAVKQEQYLPGLVGSLFDDSEVYSGLVDKLPNPGAEVAASRLGALAASKPT